MEILVCARRVPDTSENEIQLNRAGNDIERDDLVYFINEPDNYAVEEALQIVDKWLATPFAGGRHERRVEKIAAIEKEEDSTPAARKP